MTDLLPPPTNLSAVEPAAIAPLPAPPPEIEALKLLYVTNGSPLTADRWWQAHRYYQHRQNLHYQSLQQPGIVCGLGVRAIDPPESMPATLRDQRWIEIQPGIAIDAVGNPIVIEEPMTFRITSVANSRPVTVYVTLAYVNPKEKQWASLPADIVKEEFRINERSSLPTAEEVELCRIQLTDNTAPVTNADDVLNPVPQALDLRFRQQVQARPQQQVQIGVVDSPREEEFVSVMGDRASSLLQSLSGLYPTLTGSAIAQPISLNVPISPSLQPTLSHSNTTLLILSYHHATQLSDTERIHLQAYLESGATLFIEYTERSDRPTQLSELQTVQQELKKALTDLTAIKTDSALAQMRQGLAQELLECEAFARHQLQQIVEPIQQLIQKIKAFSLPLQPATALTYQPFTFDALPQLPTGTVQLQNTAGIVLAIGNLSAAWAPGQFEQPLTRETLRSAQELGINILCQANRRQQMIRAQQVTPPRVKAHSFEGTSSEPSLHQPSAHQQEDDQ